MHCVNNHHVHHCTRVSPIYAVKPENNTEVQTKQGIATRLQTSQSAHETINLFRCEKSITRNKELVVAISMFWVSKTTPW